MEKEDKYLMRIHLRKASEKNPFIVAVVYLKSSDAGAWLRVLKSKGIEGDHIAQR